MSHLNESFTRQLHALNKKTHQVSISSNYHRKSNVQLSSGGRPMVKISNQGSSNKKPAATRNSNSKNELVPGSHRSTSSRSRQSSARKSQIHALGKQIVKQETKIDFALES